MDGVFGTDRMAGALSDQEIANVAAYYASLK
jgi:cytochrome c553